MHMVVKANAKAHTKFLMYALADCDVSGYLTGSTMPKLTQDNLNSISRRIPPLSAQRRIAAILGTLDDKIDLNRRVSETLEVDDASSIRVVVRRVRSGPSQGRKTSPDATSPYHRSLS